MSFVPFVYRAWVKKIDFKTGQLVSEGVVHDGDSAWFIFDRGMYEYSSANCRLYGINAPELTRSDPVLRAKANESKLWLKTAIEGKLVWVHSESLDKYGRPLVIIWTKEADFGDVSKSVNVAMLNLGLASPYMGELLV